MTEPTTWPPATNRIDEAKTARMLAQVRKNDQRQRIFNIALVLGLLAVLLIAGVLWANSGKQDAAIGQLVSSLSKTCDQTNTKTLPTNVQADCARSQAGQVPPVAASVVGPVGATGSAGAPGAPGVGTPGVQGPQGVPGQPGQSPPCLSTPTACQGAAGGPGASGTNGGPGAPGTAGQPGVNGQTPPCLSTPAMCQGPVGTAGTNGADGKNGSPATTSVFDYPDGSEQTCTRSGGTDASPTYACKQTKQPTGPLG